MFSKFYRATNGSSAIEYAIVAGLVSIAIVVGVTNLGTQTGQMYEDVDQQVSATN